VFVSGCESPLSLTSSNIFFKSPNHFTPEIYEAPPQKYIPDGTSYLPFNISYGKYKNLKKRVYVNFNDKHGWTCRCEAQLKQRNITREEYKVLVPKYSKPLHKDIDVVVSVESHLFKQNKKKIKNSKPFSVVFHVGQKIRRNSEKIVDYREFSTDEDDDNRENKDDNVGRGRKKSIRRSTNKTKSRANSDWQKRRSSKTSSEEDNKSKSDISEEDIMNYLNLVGNSKITNRDILELIRILNLNIYDFNIDDLRGAFEDSSSSNYDQELYEHEQDDFEEILSSMHAFNEDLTDLFQLSSISEEKFNKQAESSEKTWLLSEHEMNLIIKELHEDYEEDFKETFDIPEETFYNENMLPNDDYKETSALIPNKDEICLIEETLKTMAIELPKPFTADMMDYEDESIDMISC